jgi:predicted  nucleic acid-binding Zn-ribbon protein
MNEGFLAGLKRCVQLQDKDIEIALLIEELETIPGRIALIEERIAGLSRDAEAARAKYREIQVAIKQRELDVQASDAAVAKHTAELNAVKTNEQYRALLSEIERARAEKDRVETAIIELLAQADEEQRIAQDKERELAGVRSGFEAEIGALRSRQRELEERISGRRAERETLAAAVDPDLLKTYEHVRKSRGDRGLAPIVKGSCGVCHIQLTQQEINDVVKYEEIIPCESCSRILYRPEDIS